MTGNWKRWVAHSAVGPWARQLHGTLARWTGRAPGADKSRDYDLQTVAVMRRVLKPDSNCIDVGCHEGSMLRVMLRLAPRGRHFAFEPLPGHFAGLQRTFARYPNVQLRECALSDAAGRASFQHVVSNPAYSGLRPRRYDSPDERVQQIEVRTDRLDDVVPHELPVHFVKVDVEGAELQVFRGAVETLRAHRPVVVFEHGLGGADYYGTRPGDIHDLLAGECGLRLFVMAEWLARGPALGRDAFCDQFSSGRDYYFMAAP